MYEDLAILALFAFIFSVIAGRVERSSITGPIIFIGFGLLAGPGYSRKYFAILGNCEVRLPPSQIS